MNALIIIYMNALIIICMRYNANIIVIYNSSSFLDIIIIIDVTLLLDISIIYLYKICMIRFNKINNNMIEVIIKKFPGRNRSSV